MRTPVVLACGQGDAGGVVDVLAHKPGTVLVTHRFDGQVVVRTVGACERQSDWPLEIANGCVACTVRNDLLVLLCRLHRRSDLQRIVVHRMPWLEPEPVCWAIRNVRVHVGPGYVDGPAARDVCIDAVVTCVDSSNWLGQAVGDEELDDGRTAAQVVVGQAEFADVLVLTRPDPGTLAVLRRLVLTPESRWGRPGQKWRSTIWSPTAAGAEAASPRPASGRPAAAGTRR
jgi:G3E family GTPase